MSKLSYPEDGLGYAAKGSAEYCVEKMQAAMNNCGMYVPPEFPYRDWIHGLRNGLDFHKKRFEKIKEKIEFLDKRMMTLEEETSKSIGSIEVPKIEIQDRMII